MLSGECRKIDFVREEWAVTSCPEGWNCQLFEPSFWLEFLSYCGVAIVLLKESSIPGGLPARFYEVLKPRASYSGTVRYPAVGKVPGGY